MIYDEHNKTFAVHNDSSSFIAVNIMSDINAAMYFGLEQQTPFQIFWS